MKIKKRFLGFLLSLALVLGLMPGMSLTALADAPEGIEVLNEDFSVGIPSTWSISQGTYRFEAKDGYVWADPSNGSYEEEAFCYSPAVDLSKAATAKLIFKYKRPYNPDPYFDGSDDLYVYYITNGTDNELWSDYNEDGIDEWTQVTIELPSGAFKEGVQIAFKAKNYKDLGSFFDDVSIYYKGKTEKKTEYNHTTHSYTWQDVRPATEDDDGEMVYKCECGEVLYRVPTSAFYVFNKNAQDKIKNAKQGATVKIETSRWISFHKMVMQALADRPDVSLEVSFLDGEYKGNRLSFTIPAGTDTLSLLDENGFSGFLYLAGKFGTAN